MNILLINHEVGGGGASFSLLELSQELIKKGHKIYVLTSYNEGLLAEKLRQLPVVVLYEPFYWWQTGYNSILTHIKSELVWHLQLKWINAKTAHKVAKYAKDHRIDVIHTNTSVINIGAIISKYSGIPHVWHLREFGDLDFDLHFYNDKLVAYNFMNRYTSKFICVSKAIYNHYTNLIQEKKTIIYNGVSENNLNETHYTSSNVINIIIAGHVSETKGQHEAVEACKMLIQQGINNFVLYIVGQGDLYFKIPDELKNKIQCLGEVRNLAELRKKMDIELVCSKHEAFGRVTAEAMLSGLVVIGTKSGGTPELINHGITGFLYDRGNITELCTILKYLITNPDIRESVGKHACKYAKDMFTISRCADEVEKVYISVKK